MPPENTHGPFPDQGIAVPIPLPAPLPSRPPQPPRPEPPRPQPPHPQPQPPRPQPPRPQPPRPQPPRPQPQPPRPQPPHPQPYPPHPQPYPPQPPTYEVGYNPNLALAYAYHWAYGRNPAYFNFDSMGGDANNFISQCLYAGCGVMNPARNTGWYYYSPNDRAPAWSNAEYLYTFLLNNRGRGPYGHEIQLHQARPGDIIQLITDGRGYNQSLIVTYVGHGRVYVASHSVDSFNRDLGTYGYRALRVIRIDGARR